MGKASRQRDWILQFPNSKNWFVRLRDENGKRFVQSLGTSDREQAVILALPKVAEHKKRLLAARPKIEVAWQSRLEPGLHVGPDGGHIAATERELAFYNHNGALLRTEPNGGPAHQIVGGPLSVDSLAEAYLGTDFGDGRGARRSVAVKNADDMLLETYINYNKLNARVEREARDMWSLFKTLTDNKALKDATRDDGRKLVAHFEAHGLKGVSIQKRIGWLRAAVNLAIDEGKLKFNPFAGVVPKDPKEVRLASRRKPLNDADMKETKRNLDKLADADALLFRVLASTGMRLSEAFEVDGEEKEKGCRYVVVGKKTEQSLRRVPLPASLLPYLPATIKGPMFQGGAPAASKRLNRFLNDCGIVDSRKVVHSLRHRAQDRLRAAGCPEDVRWAILGHEERTVAGGYGEGFPVTLLRKWVDEIGF
jgi:integrase